MGGRSGPASQPEPLPWLLMGTVGILLVGAAVHETARAEGMTLKLSTYVKGALGDTWGGGLVILALAALGIALILTVLDRLVHWPEGVARQSFAELSGGGLRDRIQEVRARVSRCVTEGEGDVSGAFDELIRGALSLEASDLHLSPTSQGTVATYRVHGSLHEVALLPTALGPKMTTRIKVLARLDTFARRPQDGKMRHKVGDTPFEARVSTLQADFGERVVLRLVRGGLAVPEVTALGFTDELNDSLVSILSRPQGMLFVTGPVGSGKTTTLYSALQHISQSRGKTSSMVTLEDPIELQLPFATQTQINTKVAMSFSQTLRSVLRQDPNVLMLGEIRDRETAEIAAQAGLTGHLILTTLHVDRAAGSFARMIEMGVEPFVLASTVVGSLAQRLVRSLCTNCRTPSPPTSLQLDRLRRLNLELPDADYFEAKGCEFCEGQGFTGRLPVGELLIMTPELRQAVNDRLPTDQLEAIARSAGMVPLSSSGLQRAVQGETSLGEVLRVVA